MEISESTWAFIAKHRREDVRDVALHAKHDGDVDVPFALEQIAGWQRASLKLPDWASHDGLIFPPQVPMEQCSSQFTAQYKARLAQRLLAEEAVDDDSPTSLVDLTGGFGVDFSYMSRVFNRAIYVEQQSILCDIARHNFPILGLDHAEVINDDSTAVLDTLGRVSMIFLDPARRDDHGSRTYAIADCMPDVLTLKDMLLAKHRRSWSSSPPCSTGIRPSPISPARYMRCISSPPGMSARNCCWCWGAAVTPHRSWYVLMTSRCCRTRPAITATITPLSAILPWLHAILAIPKIPCLRKARTTSIPRIGSTFTSPTPQS